MFKSGIDVEYPPEVKDKVDDLVRDMFREDELGAVVRVHIHIENLLSKLVDHLAPHPGHLKELNLDYHGLVSLALVLGLKSELGPALKAMGTLRNNFAHKLGTKLDEGTVNGLYQTLGPEDKKQVQESFERMRSEYESIKRFQKLSEMPAPERFKIIAVVLWAALQAAVLHSKSRGSHRKPVD